MAEEGGVGSLAVAEVLLCWCLVVVMAADW